MMERFTTELKSNGIIGDWYGYKSVNKIKLFINKAKDILATKIVIFKENLQDKL